MTPDWDLLADRAYVGEPPSAHAISSPAELSALPDDDAELLAVLAACTARYSGREHQVLGWSDGGPWRAVEITVDFDEPLGALIERAARALIEPARAPVPAVGIGRAGAPSAGAPALLTVLAPGAVRRAIPRYDEAEAARFAGHLAVLARQRYDDVPVGRLALLSADELALMHSGNAPVPLPVDDATLPERIREQVRARPDAVAVRAGEQQLTYAQLWQRSGFVAQQLAPASLVGVWADRSVDCMVALVGVLRAGAAYVALDPGYPPARLQAVAEAAGLTHVVGRARPDLGLKIVGTGTGTGTVADAARLSDAGSAEDREDAGPAVAADLAYVMFTSGSTGAPKGVMIEHRSVVNLLRHMAVDPGLQPGEVMLGVTTPAFDLSVPDLFLPLVTGATLVLADPGATIDGTRLAGELARHRPNLMQATPATWRMLLDAGWPGASELRIVCGGEGYDASLARTLADRVAGVWNFYGPTETTVWSTSRVLDRTTTDPVPIGRPLRGTACYVLDERGEPVPPGVRGEVNIAGAGVARGYLHRPDLTSASFVPCPFVGAPSATMYRTGDLGRISPDGELTFAGRRDLQVKINGFRVELGEVEAVVGELPGVSQAVAVTRTNGDITRLICYVTGIGLDATELRSAAALTLAPQAVPAVMVVLDEFPLNTNGKVDRSALPEPAERAGQPLDGAFEELVAEVWADVLSLPAVFADDDIFALGAYSLDVGRIAIRLTAELSMDVTPGLVFRYSTVRALAGALLETVAGAESDLLTAAEEQLR